MSRLAKTSPMPLASTFYGARYCLLCALDRVLSLWHGDRPLWLKREFVRHHVTGPIWACESRPSSEDYQALSEAERLFPEQQHYLALGSEYSPWYGTRFFHVVKTFRDRAST